MPVTGVELDTDDAVETITDFINDEVSESGMDGVVVGLSGGIDSSVSSSLAVRALGPEHVQGMVLPADSTKPDDVEDAYGHADSLGIDVIEADIEPVVESYREAFPTDVGMKEAVGNVRARTRMVFEYLEANLNNHLVLGTGNRTELLIGYFTKYGDGGVDLLPIGGLYKTEVRELATDLGVDTQIIDKAPTAGLWEGQTDKGELGATYEEIDAILKHIVDQDLSAEATAEEVNVGVGKVRKFENMYRNSEHKRTTPNYPGFGRT